MPLVVCPDCRKSISDSAPTCHQCGRPMQATPPTSKRVTQDAVQTGSQRATWRREVGSAVALVGIALSLFVMFAGQVAVGFILIVVSLVAGIVIQRG